MPWYHGPTLIEALDSVTVNKETKQMRFAVQDIYSVDAEEVVVGRVESGTLCKGDEVIFHPSGVGGKIDRIKVYGAELEKAEAGDSVGVITNCAPARGDVCGPADNPAVPTKEFLGEAVLLDESLKRGESVELRCGTKRVKCTIKEIREKLNSETGEVIEEHPAHISEHEAATIIFATDPLVVERFSDIPELGRFVLARDKNIAAGIVLEPSV